MFTMKRAMRIWKLEIACDNYQSFLPIDYTFYTERFDCRHMAQTWKLPSVEILGKSKKLADFVSWVPSAPIVSERAKSCISELVGNDVEFLPFHGLKGKPYYAMNVLRCEDYLDLNKIDTTSYTHKFFFRRNIPNILPLIFKCPGFRHQIFVTKPFADMMVVQQLRGAELADPARSYLYDYMARRETNCYPGINP